MASWVLVPCLVQLRRELDAIAPGRDRTSDGTIGDRAHQQSVSSHNDDEVGRVPVRDADSKHEVHAYDADADLRTSDLTMEKVVQHVLRRCRAGQEKRLRNIIFNRRIWAASSGWVQRTYTGSNAHDKHAHFEASYETAREADTSSWRLEDIPVAMTSADRNYVNTQIEESERRIVAAVGSMIKAAFEQRVNVNVGARGKNADGTARTPSMQRLIDVITHGSPERHDLADKIEAVGDQVDKLSAQVLAEQREGQQS